MKNELDVVRDVSLRFEGAGFPFMLTGSERRRRVVITDFSTWIVSKEDLIISKLYWAKDSRSELQLRDVRNLLATGCDKAYVREWTEKLGLVTLWRECVE